MSRAWGPEYGFKLRQVFLVLAAEQEWTTPGDIADACGVSVPTVYTWMREWRSQWSVAFAPDGVHVKSSPIVDVAMLAEWHRSGHAWTGIAGPGTWVGYAGFVPPMLRAAGEPAAGDDWPDGRLHPAARDGRAAARLEAGIRRTQDRVMARMTDGARPVGFVPSGAGGAGGAMVTPRVTANDVRENARIAGVDAPDVTD